MYFVAAKSSLNQSFGYFKYKFSFILVSIMHFKSSMDEDISANDGMSLGISPMWMAWLMSAIVASIVGRIDRGGSSTSRKSSTRLAAYQYTKHVERQLRGL